MKTKYPRTPHLPFSAGHTSDDKVLRSVEHFVGKNVVVTLKMDGENTTLYRDGFHARSLDSRHHPSRDWLAAFHATFAHDIPEGWRICGENLYARHSIFYENLPSYFMGFSVWDEQNTALSWDDTLEFFEILGIEPVTEIYRGGFSEKEIEAIARSFDIKKNEGFVVRIEDSFHYDEFASSVAKWVRPGHVQTGSHWMHSAIVPNGIMQDAVT
jgi:hypothetical protein